MSKFKQNQLLKEVIGTMAPKERIVEVANIPAPDTVNLNGAPAYALDKRLRLLAILNTSKLESQYYRSESKLMKELHDLVNDLAMENTYWVAQAIVWSRCKGEGMRSINHLAAVYLAPFISGQEWGKRFYSTWNKKEQKGGCIFRMDDMAEILGAFSALNKSKLTNAMKKGFASVLENTDAYQILKYKKTSYDVMNLCHPNSAISRAEVELNDEDFETYMKLASERAEKNGDPEPKFSSKKVKVLDAIKLGVSISAETWEAAQSEAGQIVAQAVREGKLTEQEAAEKLEKAKEGNWNQLLTEGRLGTLAALRNIRSILKVTNDAEIVKKLCVILSDKKKILEGKIMPYQMDIAYEVLRNEFKGWKYSPKVEQALIDGYMAAVPNLKEALPGKTCVVVDCSGSMTTHGCPIFSNGKRTSSIMASPADKATLIAATVASSCDADIMLFSNDAYYVEVNTKKNVFEIAQDLQRKFRPAGTNIPSTFALMTRMKKKYDRIILLSDNECNQRWNGGWVDTAYKEYIRQVCSPYVYAVDLAAYGTTPVKNDGKVNYYFGYGYSMFNDISSKEFNPNAHLDEVSKIVI